MNIDPKETEEPKTPEDFFQRWQSEPSPDNLGSVVKSLDNVIGYKLSSMNIADNPQMKHKARLMAAEAVQRYDPTSGAGLSTWTQNHLQGMQRYKRENAGPVKIPDRTVIDGWKIETASRELEDKLNREPTVKELADHAKMSVARITKVRQTNRAVASEDQMHTFGDEVVDHLDEAMEYVYDGSDAIDRKIIEFTTGYGGNKMFNKQEIAARLRISPSQVTRRTERIARKVQDMESDIDEVYI